MTDDLTPAYGYLRLSDYRTEGALDGRRELLKTRAAEYGWRLVEIVVENDEGPGNGDGSPRGASAFKRRRIRLPDGRVELRTIRPGFRRVLAAMESGLARGVLAEDLDRLLRQPRDGEDLLDHAQLSGATVRSLSGSVTLTNGGTDDERFVARVMAATANKASADIGRRVSGARDRLAGQSWQGGRRPYGYDWDRDAPKYHKTLIIVEAEAKVLRWAAALLLAGTSLKWIARDLRERRVPTVVGGPWTTRSLRDALMKPAIVALAVRKGEIIGPAPWEPILALPDGSADMETWQRLRDLLTDPARRTNTSRANEPRWLVSVWATCGVCGGLLKVGGAGRGRGPAYVGADCGHIRRDAAKVDKWVAEAALDLLRNPRVLERLRPPARPGVDVAGLRAELRKLADRRARYQGMAADGTIEDDDLTGILAGIRQRETAIGVQLAASSAEPDVLARFRVEPVDAVWAGLPMAARRAAVQRLYGGLVILPAGRGNRFDPTRLKLTPRGDLAA
jgi:site-specific DNA recombinase